MEILQIKIDLPIIPDYDMGNSKDAFIDEIHSIKGCQETMLHSGSWATFNVNGATYDEFVKDFERIRNNVDIVIKKFKFKLNEFNRE
jgi:hypothetical protein